MNVSATPSELSPGRIQALLGDGRAEIRASLPDLAATGTLSVSLRIEGADGPIGSPPADGAGGALERGYRIAEPGGGLAALVASVVRGARIEGRRTRDGEMTLSLPDTAARWMTDGSLLWSVLCGTYGGTSAVPEIEEVDSGALGEVVTAGRLWHCRLEAPNAGDPIAAWLVAETGDATEGHPSRRLAAGLNMMRDALRRAGLGELDLKVRRKPPSSIGGGSAMLRITSPGWHALWPARAVTRLMEALVSGDRGDHEALLSAGARDGRARRVGLERAATLRLLDGELTTNGLVRLLQTLPRTPSEKLGRYAVRTVVELARAGGVVTREFAESAYRSSSAYRDLAQIVRWLPETIRDRCAAALGRRWEQLSDHGARGRVGAAGEPWRAYPWIAVSEACERLVSDLAARARRAGDGPSAATGEVVERFYTAPRGERLSAVWRRQLASGDLGRALEETMLSRLRRELPHVPRQLLVLAVLEEDRDTKRRASAVFSRRGRALFLEDVAALEAAIRRREFREWDRVLSARRELMRRLTPERRNTAPPVSRAPGR